VPRQLVPKFLAAHAKAQDERDEPATVAEKKPPAPKVVEVPEQYTT
jgi:hypothetical protein